jgi:hypothetical protein
MGGEQGLVANPHKTTSQSADWYPGKSGGLQAKLEIGLVDTLISSKFGFATLLDPHGGRPASAGLGALSAGAAILDHGISGARHGACDDKP